MQLAGRALLLYLNHAVLAKQSGRLAHPVSVNFANATPELRVQSAALIKCNGQSAYTRGFESFFSLIEALSSSQAPVPLSTYKRELVRTLLPMAPYLSGF